jgi:hypothetical protein
MEPRIACIFKKKKSHSLKRMIGGEIVIISRFRQAGLNYDGNYSPGTQVAKLMCDTLLTRLGTRTKECNTNASPRLLKSLGGMKVVYSGMRGKILNMNREPSI